MRIGELAAQAGIATKAIRYYEQIGILTPPARTPSGYRSYDQTALGRLGFVRAAQALGLTLGEIRQIIAFRYDGAAPCAPRHPAAAATRRRPQWAHPGTPAAPRRAPPAGRAATTLDPEHCHPSASATSSPDASCPSALKAGPTRRHGHRMNQRPGGTLERKENCHGDAH